MDTLDFLQSNNGARLAVAEVLDFGQQTGREMGIVLDRQGNRQLALKGDSDHVEWPAETHGLLLSIPDGLLIHNHPAPFSAALSWPDILNAEGRKGETVAVTADGGIYCSRGRTPAAVQDDRAAAFFAILMAAVHGFARRIDAEADRVIFENHALALSLSNAGIIDYRFRLGSETRRVFEELGFPPLEPIHV